MKEPHDTFESNLEKMIAEGLEMPDSDFQDRLEGAVLAEARRQRGRLGVNFWLRRVAIAAVVVLVASAVVWLMRPERPGAVGQVKTAEGIVLLGDAGAERREITGPSEVHARQTIQTLSGSRAAIQLADRSWLRPEPRTVLQLRRGSHGAEVVLEQGAVSLEVTKQSGGRYLSVETPNSRLRILGTELDVRVATKPDGAKQTRVSVHSGAVELGSGNRRTLLLPGTVGIADEGQPPVRRSTCFEVNEMIELVEKTEDLADAAGSRAGAPAIIDLVAGSLWTVVPAEKLRALGNGWFALELRLSAFGVRAYTLEGAALETSPEGKTLLFDLSGRPQAAGPVEKLILRIPRLNGLLDTAEGVLEFARPAEPEVLTLYQFHIRSTTGVELIDGEIIDTAERFGKSIVTVAARAQTLQVCP
jgi:ferric-dicitrate binding protein FerR (iron transport regulator)